MHWMVGTLIPMRMGLGWGDFRLAFSFDNVVQHREVFGYRDC